MVNRKDAAWVGYFLLLWLFCTIPLYGQAPRMPATVSLGGEMGTFIEQPKEIFLKWSAELNKEEQELLFSSLNIDKRIAQATYEKPLQGWFLTLIAESDWPKVYEALINHPQLVYITQGVTTGDGTHEFPLPTLYAKSLPGVSSQFLQQSWAIAGMRVRFGPTPDDPVRLSMPAKTGAEVLGYANEQTGMRLFEYIEPDMLRRMPRLTADPLYSKQWALENIGSSSQYNGTPGEDMDVQSAWAETMGDPSISVAIIDEGVDLNHPDLLPNLLPGFDGFGTTYGGPINNDAHGTACAGIVAAVANNNIGVAGVAPNCKIIPVRIAYSSGSYWVTSSSIIANCINWAWNQGGADVLSNSWGGGSASTLITNAINNAVANGRNGLGAPVLFASGNSNSNTVSYPASLNNVIAVAASSMCGERKNPSSCDGEFWWGANYGNLVDVSAPGVKIATTDISGSAGYRSDDYTETFNGTSSACPNAAGVMALILSADPSLTLTEARYYLESTTEKVGGYAYSNHSDHPNGTWSSELGYGRVNARRAIEAIANPSTCFSQITPSISILTQSSATLTLDNRSANDDAFIIEYGQQGLFPNVITTVETSDASILLNALSPRTTYIVQVRVICASGDTSSIRSTSFTTLCGNATAPYLETFDSWPPDCWDLSGSDVTVSQANGDYLEASFWFWPDNIAYATTQPIFISSDAHVSFKWAHKYHAFYPNDQMTLQARLVNGNTWSTLFEIGQQAFDSPNATNYNPPAEEDFVSESIPLSNSPFEGEEVVFRFVFESGYGPHAYIDDFEITSCSASDLRAVSVDPYDACGEEVTTATIRIDGDLHDAAHWVIYTGSCGSVREGQTTNNTYVLPIGQTTTVYVRAEGGCSDSEACQSVMIFRGDEEPPVARCQSAQVVLDAEGSGSLLVNQIDQGSSDNCSDISLSIDKASFTCLDLGEVDVVLTVTDEGNNTDTCHSQVTVVDLLLPEISCGSDTLYLDEDGAAMASALTLAEQYWDNCGEIRFTLSKDHFTCLDLGTSLVNLTASDASNNARNCLATVVVLDTIAPQVSCVDTTLYMDTAGMISIDTNSIDLSDYLIENCAVTDFRLSDHAFSCSLGDTFEITLTVYDESGNEGSCVAQISVLDTIAPVMTCQPAEIYLDDSGLGTLIPDSLDGGSTDQCAVLEFSASRTVFTCDDIGFSQSVTLTATDVHGNSASCMTSVMVMDSIAPNAECTPQTVYLQNANFVGLSAFNVDNNSTDNCGVAQWFLSPSYFNCSDIGENPVTLFIQDRSGNLGECHTTVTVVDTVRPTAVCQDIEIYLSHAGQATITPEMIDMSSDDNCSVTSRSLDRTLMTCADIGVQNVMLMVGDPSENLDTCYATVTVTDTITAVASCINPTLYLDSVGQLTITPDDIDASGPDACGVLSRTLDRSTFSCSDIGENQVTLTLVNLEGATSFCESTITILDTTPPVALCRDTILYLDEFGTIDAFAIDIDSGSWDNCSMADLSQIHVDVPCFHGTSFDVLLQASDDAENSSFCLGTVMLQDTFPPVALCRDTTVFLTAMGTAEITPDWVDHGSYDACRVMGRALTKAVFSCQDIGVQSTTLQITDAAGLMAECVASITVVDTITPQASCLDITVFLNDTGMVTLTPLMLDARPEACDIQSRSIDLHQFSCADVGIQMVDLHITDIHGVSTSCTSNVTVLDTLPPVIQCRDTIIYLDTEGKANLSVDLIDAGSYDNCSIVEKEPITTDFTCLDVGMQEVVFRITDASGSSHACTSVITVVDSLLPVALCRDTTLYLDEFGEVMLDATLIDAGSYDNCGTISRTTDWTEMGCNAVGTQLVTLRIASERGDTAECQAQVTVLDTIAPQLLVGDLAVDLSTVGEHHIDSLDLLALFHDACGPVDLDTFGFQFDCSMLGRLIKLIRATDINGNATTVRLSVWVRDTTGITCNNDIICDDHPWDREYNDDQNDHRSVFAQRQIRARGRINSGKETVYQAGESITLEAGFHARRGSSLRARIRPCRPRADAEHPIVGTFLPALTTSPTKASMVDLKVSPNPAYELATIHLELSEKQKCELILFDMQGRPVQVILPDQNWEPGVYDIDTYVGHLSGGIYSVQLRTQKGLWTRQLVVVK